MSHQVIRQPDGLFAVFSTVTDTLIIVDATAEELADHHATEAAEKARAETLRIAALVSEGEAPEVYGRFVMTWDEALATSREHGGDLEPDRGITP